MTLQRHEISDTERNLEDEQIIIRMFYHLITPSKS